MIRTIYTTELYLKTFEHFDTTEDVVVPDGDTAYVPHHFSEAVHTDEDIVVAESLVSFADCHEKIAAKLVERYRTFAKAVCSFVVNRLTPEEEAEVKLLYKELEQDIKAGDVWGLNPNKDWET
jgi:hypothetical protein